MTHVIRHILHTYVRSTRLVSVWPLVTAAMFYCRCMECRLRVGWVAIRSTYFPRRLGCWSASWDYQGPWHSYQGADPRNESQLHRVQIPTDQIPSLAKGMEGMALEDIVETRKINAQHYNKSCKEFMSWLKLHALSIFVQYNLLSIITLGFLM
jgi:hypothetical protein